MTNETEHMSPCFDDETMQMPTWTIVNVGDEYFGRPKHFASSVVVAPAFKQATTLEHIGHKAGALVAAVASRLKL
ncbi:MAG TPA: hypothetical protein VIN59_00075 [Alphaproteobacteria bacterium]